MNTVIDMTEHDLFACDFSDEAVEAAAGMTTGIEATIDCTWSVTTECNPC